MDHFTIWKWIGSRGEWGYKASPYQDGDLKKVLRGVYRDPDAPSFSNYQQGVVAIVAAPDKKEALRQFAEHGTEAGKDLNLKAAVAGQPRVV